MRVFSMGLGIALAALATVVLVALLGLAQQQELPLVVSALAGAGLVLVLGTLFCLWNVTRALGRAVAICAAATRGDLEARILEMPMAGGIGRLQGGINALLDVTDAFVREAKGSMQYASQGRYFRRVLLRGLPGSFEVASRSINAATAVMATTHDRLREVAAAVAGAASEITSGSVDLSGRTEAQASALEQTAASMEELAATIRTNADNARRADQVAVTARDAAEQGGQVVGQAVDAMHRIEASSQRIADIIGIIDELAHQTSLLALNASVEAARAGEAGRGFAVVASEVRSLAQRSGHASKEIKTLIMTSGQEVKEGVTLVQQAGGTLSKILASVQDVARLVSEIATASLEQAEGVEQVNQAVSSMDDMTQGNAALAEESAAAARSLEERAQEMAGLMKGAQQDNAAPALAEAA